MKFREKFEKYKEEAFDLLRNVISYPTVLDEFKEDSNEPFGRANRECLEYVLNKAKNDGFEIFNAKNYAGHIEYGNGKETLGILVHLDVVPVDTSEWDSDPFVLTIKDDKLYARGIEDDKGAFVANYIALKILKDEGFIPKKKIRIIIGCNEESGSRCIRKYFTMQKEPDFAYSPDAAFPCINGEKAMAGYDIKVFDNVITYFKAGERYNVVPSYAEMQININLEKEYIKFLNDNNYEGKIENGIYKAYGKAAHSMCPWNGVNAAYILFDFLNKYSNSKLAEFIDKYYLYDVYGKKAGYNDYDSEMKDLTSNFAIVDINDSIGKFGVNCRMPKNEDGQLVKNVISEIVKDYGFEILKFHAGDRHYVDSDSFLVKTLVESYSNVTGDKENKAFSIGGGTYARECHNPAVAFGPQFVGREDVCHIANEYMYIEDFYKIIEIYYNAIYNLTK